MLLLVPFILTWTIGYLGFSSFFAFLVALSVYWGIFTKNRYIRKHAWLSELVGTCITGENAALEEKQRLYRQCKLASIPMHQVPGHLMHNDQQRAEWLNVIIGQMWPFISDFIKRILREVRPVQAPTTPFFRTDPLLYHKFENMIIFWSGTFLMMSTPSF